MAYQLITDGTSKKLFKLLFSFSILTKSVQLWLYNDVAMVLCNRSFCVTVRKPKMFILMSGLVLCAIVELAYPCLNIKVYLKVSYLQIASFQSKKKQLHLADVYNLLLAYAI